MWTIIILVILVLIAIYAIRSYCKKLSSGCCGSDGGKVKKIKANGNVSDYPYQYEITIDGMVCQSCATRVENAFHAKDGFAAKVDLQKKCALVGAEQEVTEEFLRTTVKEAGYTALKIHSKQNV